MPPGSPGRAADRDFGCPITTTADGPRWPGSGEYLSCRGARSEQDLISGQGYLTAIVELFLEIGGDAGAVPPTSRGDRPGESHRLVTKGSAGGIRSPLRDPPSLNTLGM